MIFAGRYIRVSRDVQDAISEEARWLTDPASANRWRFGTWVDTVAHNPRGGYGSLGCPAWFLPWNRPRKKTK